MRDFSANQKAKQLKKIVISQQKRVAAANSGEKGVSMLFLVKKMARDFSANHNYNKIVKSDWLSTALISALIGQFNRTVRVMPK